MPGPHSGVDLRLTLAVKHGKVSMFTVYRSYCTVSATETRGYNQHLHTPVA